VPEVQANCTFAPDLRKGKKKKKVADIFDGCD